MADLDFDLVVIGGGSGGVRAARVAASLGARVALAEEHRVGGTCVIRGCVPKKLMVLASRFAGDFEDAEGFGWSVGPRTFDWGKLVDALGGEVSRLEGLYRKGLEGSGVTVFNERATLESGAVVRLQASGTLLHAKHVLLATGSAPSRLQVPGAEHCITSDDAFSLPEQPKQVVVLGGGYIAVELGCALQRLGSAVTILHRSATLLRGFDSMLQDGLTSGMLDAGVTLVGGAVATRVEQRADGVFVHDSNGVVHRADVVLNATGRLPRTESLGLDRCGIELDANGAVRVDGSHRTANPNVYAVGDVTNRLNLTPVAIRQGHEVAHALFGGPELPPVRYDIAPTAVFSTPEIGTAGLTEQAARKQLKNLRVFKTQFRPMRATLAGSSERTAMKLLVCGDTDKVVGVHLLGRDAAEQIQLAGVALQLGATKRDFDQTLAVHPTAAEELVTLKSWS